MSCVNGTHNYYPLLSLLLHHKSATLDNMDGSDAILCWQSTNHNVRLLLVCIYCVTVVVLLLRC